MSGNDRPTGLVAASDHIAVGVYRALRERGLEPGRDVGVVCVGDGSFASYMHPSLTMAMIPVHELGRIAAELLIDLIVGTETRPKTIVVPWRLEVRDSTLAFRP